MFLYCSLLRSSEGFFHEASRIFAEKGLLREGIPRPYGNEAASQDYQYIFGWLMMV